MLLSFDLCNNLFFAALIRKPCEDFNKDNKIQQNTKY